jgi:S1-C subfamily serine protease
MAGLAAFVLVLLALPPAEADTMSGAETAPCSPEGFSTSWDGLSEPVLDAWLATVLIQGQAIVAHSGDDPKIRTNRGSGVVVRLKRGGRSAVVVTNAHVLRCRERVCNPQVGFADREDPGGQVWTDEARVIWSDDARDLAFVEVRVPRHAEVKQARFASTDCIDSEARDVVAIGWPDLTSRTRWGVDPPQNSSDHVKRYSTGKFLISLGSYRPRPQVRHKMERMSVVFHNADVLPGSSGGALVNTRGEIVGINTHVVGNTDRSVHNQYCARQEIHEPGSGCVHLAIASTEVVEVYRQVYSNKIKLAQCTSPSDVDDSQRVASMSVNQP